MSFGFVPKVRIVAPGRRVLPTNRKREIKDRRPLTSGLNPTERTIIVSVSFVVALVISIVFHQTGLPLAPIAYITFAFPLLFGARALRLPGSLYLSAGIAAACVTLLLVLGTRSPLWLILFPVTYVSIGGAIGWSNDRRFARRAMWQQPRSLKDRFDDKIFEPALNILHFVDREGMVQQRNEASRTALGHLTKRS
ncbi:hypothetical protein ACFLSF_04915, partial [Candidatus Bipolaricaulota bacterium]